MEKLWAVVAGITALCAVIVTGLLLKREFVPGDNPSRRNEPTEITYLEDWRIYAAEGKRIGDPEAPIVILEFSDFECPFCARFALDVLPKVRAKYGAAVQLVYRHWPLPYHKFSKPAARASECAHQQGRFEPMHDLLFAQQDSFGLKAFEAIAREAGVQDLPAWNECFVSRTPLSAMVADSLATESLPLNGTPTVFVNGFRFPGTPDFATIDSVIAAQLSN